MYLIDTNVLSEYRKGARGDPGVRAFLHHCRENRETQFLSVITLGEIRYGIEKNRRRGDQPQADMFEQWLARVAMDFRHDILNVDEDVAAQWGWLRAQHTEDEVDALLAATASVHDLTVVTRNVAHFQRAAVRVLNPFSDAR